MGESACRQLASFSLSPHSNIQKWCPGGESNPHEEKSPEDFKSSASAIPPPGQWHYKSSERRRLLQHLQHRYSFAETKFAAHCGAHVGSIGKSRTSGRLSSSRRLRGVAAQYRH